METYEQKYKFAIEQAKKELEACGSMDCDAARQIFRLFPELAESKDERIRKEIICYLDREITLSNFGGDIATFKGWIDWLKKQDEEKPSKVEPKFKVGDWVVEINSSRHPYKIIEVCESWYEIIDTDDFHYSIDFKSKAKDFRLWTIQDAKNGDVLILGDHGRLIVGIVSYVNKTTGKVDVNCLLENNNFKMGNYYNLDTINPHPATKEQRDLLFQKMKEEGYKWDAEKKKLIRYEQ